MASTNTRGSGWLMLAGAALLVLGLGIFGYGRFVQWQHSVALVSIAPPTESLPDRLPVPTRVARP
jgi:hypothetical protein